jgi:O-antigen ligase
MFHVAALLFILWAGAAQLFFHFGEPLPGKFLTFIQLFLVLWMIWELATTRQRQLGLLVAYVLGAYVGAIDTLLLYRKAGAALRRFAAGDPNELAMALALALPMAWYLGMTHRRPLIRWLARGYLPIGLVAIGLTGSRGGLLVSLTGLLIVPLSMTRLSPARMAGAIALLVVSGVFAVKYVPETIVDRLATTGTELEDAKFGGRFKIWKAGLEAFTKRPIDGYGTSSFILIIKPRMGSRAQVAHNSYLSLLVEQGLIGFVLYMGMFVAVFLAVLNLPALERRFALVLLAAAALSISPLTWEDSKAVWFILAALLGLAKAPVTWHGPPVPQPRLQQARPDAAVGGSGRSPLGQLRLPARNFPGDDPA